MSRLRSLLNLLRSLLLTSILDLFEFVVNFQSNSSQVFEGISKVDGSRNIIDVSSFEGQSSQIFDSILEFLNDVLRIQRADIFVQNSSVVISVEHIHVIEEWFDSHFLQ